MGLGLRKMAGKIRGKSGEARKGAGKWKNTGKWKISFGKYSNDAITSLSFHDRQSYIPIKAFWLIINEIIKIQIIMEATFILKLVLMVAFFLEVTIFGNFISGLECFKTKRIMDLAMTFAGTLFLSIALIDVVPEAIENFNDFIAKQPLQYQGSLLHRGKIPLTMFIAMGTLLFIMWLDKILIGHSHDHQYEISFVAGPKKHNDAPGMVEEHEHQNDEFQDVGTEHRHEERELAHKNEEGEAHATNWKPFVLQVGMAIHAFFETLAVGLQGSVMSVVGLATAILVHKWAEGLTLALLYKKQGFNAKTITIAIIFQGFVNVLGLLIGSILMGQGHFVMAFFMSMSAGTFLYISLFEVLQEQLKEFTKNKMIMVVIANIFVACIVWFEKSEESSQI